MTPDDPTDLADRVLQLEEQLESALTQVDQLEQAHRLTVDLRAHLVNRTYALLRSSESLSYVSRSDERRSLLSSLRLSAYRLEDAIDKLSTVAAAMTSSLPVHTVGRSVDSLTNEAVLRAASLLPADGPSIHLESTPESDSIVAVDTDLVVQSLASSFNLLRTLFHAKELHARWRLDTVGDSAIARWTFSPQAELPTQYPGSDRSLPEIEDPSISLDLQFIASLSAPLGLSLSQPDDQVLQLEARCPFIRSVERHQLPDVPSPWVDRPVVCLSDPPDRFTPVPVSLVRSPGSASLQDFCASTSPCLLMLHHEGGGTSFDVSGNLEAARQVDLPVVLRASSLDYPDYVRYRDSVDVVILEPSPPETLARYVVGLSRSSDRRSSPRLAEIH